MLVILEASGHFSSREMILLDHMLPAYVLTKGSCDGAMIYSFCDIVESVFVFSV